MPANPNPNRKANDDDLIRYNSLGYSLTTIGALLGVHQTTVTLRLKAMNVQPADTRRTFMEDVLTPFSNRQREALANKLGPTHSIKDYVRNLIARDLLSKEPTP